MAKKRSSKKTKSKKKTGSRKNTKNTKKKSKSKSKKAKIKVKNKNKSKKPTEVRYHSTKEIKVEKALIDNFVGLQKVMVNLSSRFDKLSDEMSKLLNLFEVSAKAMAKKEFASEKDPEIKKLHDKLDNLSKQAGLIGKGLALIHEANKESHEETQKVGRFEPHPSNTPRSTPRPMPAPKMPTPMKQQRPQNQQGQGQRKEESQVRELQPQAQGQNQMQKSIMPSEAEMTQKNVQEKKPQNQQGQQQIQNQSQEQGSQNAQKNF